MEERKDGPLKNLRIQKILPLCFLSVVALSFPAQHKPHRRSQGLSHPSWRVGSSVNPVRLLVRGKNLQNARLNTVGGGWRIVGAPKLTSVERTYSLI